jgi:5-formaminoimidazole-4-carboxamide-1-beta-D-ribofuranosyl 5'-monophosphate synthetase
MFCESSNIVAAFVIAKFHSNTFDIFANTEFQHTFRVSYCEVPTHPMCMILRSSLLGSVFEVSNRFV